MVGAAVGWISVVVQLALREITVRLDTVYLQGVHVQDPAGMEHAGLTTRVSVIQAGMGNYVTKVSGWKLTI
jgi:hypothetical protein